MDSVAPKHDETVVKEFSELVSDRVLEIDTISKVIMAAQGALWKHRKVGASASVSMESRIASHVIALHRALLQSGITELDEAAKIVEEDLAMRITATFRRTLPALRVASKWLRANIDYVLGATRKDVSNSERGPVISHISEFWEAYTSFATRIVLVFPPTSLPKLKRSLEEDFDTRGFLPLGDILIQGAMTTELEGQDLRALEQVHPNEEQLMRIWDIGYDARLVAGIPGTQMESFRAQFSLIDSVDENETLVSQRVTATEASAAVQLASDDRQLDEDARTETTDPVGDAFREVLGVPSDDEQEDEIVWNPRYVLLITLFQCHLSQMVYSPVSPPTITPVLSNKSTPRGRTGVMSPLSPISPTRANIGVGSTSPPRGSNVFTQSVNTAGQPPSTSKTTAQDLLNNVMGLGRPAPKADLKSSFSPHFAQQQVIHSPARHHQRLPSSSQPQTLFGGGAGPSIWSAAPDENGLGLSPRHQGNGTLPGSPLAGLAPLAHASLQAVVPGIPSATHSGVSPNIVTPSAHPSWPPYDHMEQKLPIHTSHAPPTFSALIEHNDRRMPSPSVGLNDGYADSGFHGSVVYASSPRQAPLPSHVSSTFSAQQSLPSAFNNSMVLSSTIDPPHYQSMATLNPTNYPISHTNYPISHTTDALFGFAKYGDVRRQRTDGVWGDAG